MSIVDRALDWLRPDGRPLPPPGDMRQYVDHAYSLLRDANRKSVQIPEDVVRVITQARHELAPDSSPEFEAAFWNAYGVLSSSIKPAERARRMYRAIFYVVLATLLVAQFLFLSLDYSIRKINDLSKPIAEVPAAVESSEPSPAAANPQEGAGQSKSAGSSETTSLTQQQRAAYYDLSTNWLNLVGLGYLLPAYKERDAAYETKIRGTLDLLALFLSSYLLPMLYGLLGACAFVLRKLSDPIAKLTYAHDSQVRYSLRLNIGLLAGLAVGWFIKPGEGDASLVSLSPLALAFVAGYGSDLFFAALDKLVQAFAPAPTSGERTVTEVTSGGITSREEESREIRVAGQDEERRDIRVAGQEESEDRRSAAAA